MKDYDLLSDIKKDVDYEDSKIKFDAAKFKRFKIRNCKELGNRMNMQIIDSIFCEITLNTFNISLIQVNTRSISYQYK